MENPYCFTDGKTGRYSPRFWLRGGVSFLIALLLFWSAGGLGADVISLFSQSFALLKLLFMVLGSIGIGEFMFYAVRWVFLKYGKESDRKLFFFRVAGLGVGVALLLIALWSLLLRLVFGAQVEGFLYSVSLLMIFLVLMNYNVMYLLVFLSQQKRYLEGIEVFYGGQLVRLAVADIAYLFYKEGIFYVTSHKGIPYESSFASDLEGFFEQLDPADFFMINAFAVVSRKACKDFVELSDGTIKVNLVPPPMMSRTFEEDVRHGVYDFLNYN